VEASAVNSVCSIPHREDAIVKCSADVYGVLTSDVSSAGLSLCGTCTATHGVVFASTTARVAVEAARLNNFDDWANARTHGGVVMKFQLRTV